MKYRKALIIGSNGMLGQAFSREIEAMDVEPIRIARSNANYCLDLNNFEIIPNSLHHPQIIII